MTNPGSSAGRSQPGAHQEPIVSPATGTVLDRRSEIIASSGVNMLVGVWLVASPLVLDYTAGDAVWNPIVVGAVVIGCGLLRVSVPRSRTSWSSALNAIAGLWLFVSSFWLATSAAGFSNGVVTGAIVFLIGGWSAVTSTGSTSPAAPRARR